MTKAKLTVHAHTSVHKEEKGKITNSQHGKYNTKQNSSQFFYSHESSDKHISWLQS